MAINGFQAFKRLVESRLGNENKRDSIKVYLKEGVSNDAYSYLVTFLNALSEVDEVIRDN